MKLLRAALGGGQRRTVETRARHLLHAVAALTAVWSVYQSLWSTIDVVSLTIVFLSLTICLTFLAYAPTKNSDLSRISLVDYLLAALAIVGGIYFTAKVDVMMIRISLFDPLTPWDITFASMLLLMLLESVRRTIGLTMCVIVLLLFGYNLYGNYMPGFIRHNGINYLHYLDIAFFTTDGVFGTPLRVAATYGFLFVIFGTLLNRCGGGEFFYRLAATAARKPGGPAKISVVSSGLFGTISGNPVADVVATGPITIPMMVKVGYQPKDAAAIEAAASTGGTLIPPVMGAAAFIMAEFTAIPYRTIAAAAVIPMAMFYLSLYLQVHFHALRKGIKGSDIKTESVMTVLKEDYLFLAPLVVLLIVLIHGYSPSMVAFSAAVTVVIVATLRSSTRMNPTVLYAQLVESTERILPVAMACAAAGLVMGGLTMTGLSNKFSELILFTSAGTLTGALLTAAVIVIILGMGLPTSASYILSAVLVSGILISMDLSVLQAHMFLLYFAALSAITPPVAIAAFAAAALAKTDPLTTSVYAMRKGCVAFLAPFAFVMHGELLLEGTVTQIMIATPFALLSVVCISAGIEKYLLGELRLWERILMLVAGAMMLLLPIEWQLLGLLIGTVGVLRNATTRLRERRSVKAAHRGG